MSRVEGYPDSWEDPEGRNPNMVPYTIICLTSRNPCNSQKELCLGFRVKGCKQHAANRSLLGRSRRGLLANDFGQRREDLENASKYNPFDRSPPLVQIAFGW